MPDTPVHHTDQVTALDRYDPRCPECARLRIRGRGHHDPVHCIVCHLSWTGVEAQHCVGCHRTFASVFAADLHRKGGDGCIDPAVTDGWHEKRADVWTYGRRPPEAPGATSIRPG